MRVWVRFGFGLASVFAVSVLLTLAVWATVVPLILGWKPASIVSGSMEPLIGVGDVVVAEPYSNEELGPGTVIVFRDPSKPDGLITHRIDAVDGQGDYVTKGDANARADSTPIGKEDIVGVGRILVPEIGWPAVWAARGETQSLVLAGVIWLFALYFARWGALERFDPWLQHAPAHDRPRTGRGRHLEKGHPGLLRHIIGIGSSLGVTAALLTFGFTSAGLAAMTSNDANQMLASDFQPPSNLQLTDTCTAGQPITFRAATTANGQGTAIVLNTPAGTVSGDVMVAHIVLRDDVALTLPLGWSLVRRSTAGPYSAIYVKAAGTAEPPSHTWLASNVRFAAGLGSWANVDNTSPIHVHGGSSGSGSTIVAPSLTTSIANTMLVAFWSIRDDRGVTIPTSMVKRWEVSSTQAGARFHQVQSTGGTEAFSGTGATGTRTATSPASEENVGQMVALRPASGGTLTVDATWTATPSLFATGHKLQRWLGAVQQTEQTISPRTVTTATDSSVLAGVTYEYRLFAYLDSSWTSAEISQSITTTSC